MVRSLRADRKRQATAIDNRHDFYAFPRFVAPMSAPPLAIRSHIDKAFFFVLRASITKLVGNIS
jgi:hypothetical protein